MQDEEMELPEVANLVETPDEWSADLKFDPSAQYFQGHFPGFPVLAGVVQLGVAHRVAEKWTGRQLTLKMVKKLKFSRVVQPGETVRLSLARKSDSEISFLYEKKGSPCATGTLCF